MMDKGEGSSAGWESLTPVKAEREGRIAWEVSDFSAALRKSLHNKGGAPAKVTY